MLDIGDVFGMPFKEATDIEDPYLNQKVLVPFYNDKRKLLTSDGWQDFLRPKLDLYAGTDPQDRIMASDEYQKWRSSLPESSSDAGMREFMQWQPGLYNDLMGRVGNEEKFLEEQRDSLLKGLDEKIYYLDHPEEQESNGLFDMVTDNLPMVVGVGASLLSGGLTAPAMGGWAGAATPFLNGALSSMGAKAFGNLAQGQDWNDGLLKAGVIGALGTYGAKLGASGAIGKGLQNLGLSPELAASLSKPLTSGGMGAIKTLVNGGDLGDALKNGFASSIGSYGGAQLGGFLKDAGFDPALVQGLSSAGRSAITAGISGGDPMKAALSSALNFGTGKATDFIKNSFNSDGGQMGWLDDLYSTFSGGSDTTQFDNLPELTNWSPTGGYVDPTDYLYDFDRTGNTEGNWYDHLPELDNWKPENPTGANGGNFFDYENLLQDIDPGMVSGGGSSAGFLQNLYKQLNGLKGAASDNPLAAISALIGGVGSIRNAISGTPNDLGKVTELMNQNKAAVNAPVAVPTREQIVARDPRFFTTDKPQEPVYTPPQGGLSSYRGY